MLILREMFQALFLLFRMSFMEQVHIWVQNGISSSCSIYNYYTPWYLPQFQIPVIPSCPEPFRKDSRRAHCLREWHQTIKIIRSCCHCRRVLHNSLYHRKIPVAFLHHNSRCFCPYKDRAATGEGPHYPWNCCLTVRRKWGIIVLGSHPVYPNKCN